jgi:hypothetical protein
VYWDTGEDRGDDRRNAPENAHSHDYVKRNAHLSHSKDSAILQKDGHFGEHETGVVADDTPEQVLPYVSLEVYTSRGSSPLG